MVQDALCEMNHRNTVSVLPKVDEVLKVMLIRVLFSYEFNLDTESLILSLLGLTVQSFLVTGYPGKSNAG